MSYGMDADGDGMLDFAELQAYEAYKQQMKDEAAALAAKEKAALAAMEAKMVSTYETVPGFAARRGWHGNSLNEHNYGEVIKSDTAVFPCNKLAPGAMAQMLTKPVSPTVGVPMEPRGRARERGGGGVEVGGPFAFMEGDRLVAAMQPGYKPSVHGAGNAFDSKIFTGGY